MGMDSKVYSKTMKNAEIDRIRTPTAFLLVAAALGLFSFNVQSRAGPGSVTGLNRLLGSADAVVIGTAPESTMTVGAYEFQVQVSRSLKGDLQRGAVIPVKWTSIDKASGSVPPITGLWFLKKGPKNDWRVLPVVSGAVTSGQLTLIASEDALDEAASESLEERATKSICHAHKYRDLEAHEASVMLGTFHPMGSPASAEICFPILASATSPRTRSVGLAGLIMLGNATALEQAVAGVNSLDEHARANIANGISLYRNPDPVGIELIGRLASATKFGKRLRFGAAYALRKICTPEVLPHLVVMLDDPDRDVRYQAMAGLASFANHGHMIEQARKSPEGTEVEDTDGPFTTDATRANFPTITTFERNEEPYIAFWKSWWNANASRIVR
jgi:hypothetical protein